MDLEMAREYKVKKLSLDREKELFGPEAIVVKAEVIQADGSVTRERQTAYEPNAIQAVRNIVGMEPVKITVRTCLGCSEKFESEGISNRLCEECRSYRGMI